MSAPANFRPITPLVLIFVLISIFCLAFRSKLSEWSIDWKLVAAGNFILFLVSLFSYYLHFKALTTANNHAFLRFVYSAFIGKFFLILAFVVVYALAAGKASNRYGLFACLGLYIVYTFIETTALMKMNKRKNA
jgi:hypothetical protein